jgi:hypothetical protein
MQSESHAVIEARAGTKRARVSLARSLRPMTSTSSRELGSAATAAIEPACRIAIGVSIIAHSRTRSGAPASRNSRAACMTEPGPSILGRRIASGPAAAAAARSSRPHIVWEALTRMMISRPPNPPARTSATTWSRAAALASGATESSRSRMTASAGRLRALAIARGFEPGM